jgi:hypothetical protein
MNLMKSAGLSPRFFAAACPCNPIDRPSMIVAMAGLVLENRMVPDQTIACRLVSRIVIDDRSRLPGRFFGRFTTSATSGLARAV